MNFLEAVKAMKEGKKVRRPSWREESYLILRGHTIGHSNGEQAYLTYNSIEATDWEIVIDFDTLFKKLAIYSRREGLNHVADFFDTKKYFFSELFKTQIKSDNEVSDKEIADLENELKKLEDKDTYYGLLEHLKSIDKTLKDIAENMKEKKL